MALKKTSWGLTQHFLFQNASSFLKKNLKENIPYILTKSDLDNQNTTQNSKYLINPEQAGTDLCNVNLICGFFSTHPALVRSGLPT